MKTALTDVCKYFHIHKWGEPPTEPDENGTVETETQCKIKKGNNITDCFGDLDLCEVLINKSNTIQLIDDMIENDNQTEYIGTITENDRTKALTELKSKI